MGEPILAIARTYIRRPSRDVQAINPVMGVFSLFLASVLAIPGHWRVSNSIVWTPTVSMSSAFIGFAIWGRLRQHLLSDRRRLWPHFVRPHVVVFATLLFLLGVAWPLIVGLRTGIDPLGLIVFVMILYAVTGLGVARPRGVALVLWLIVYLALLFAADRWPIRDVLAGNDPALATGLLVITLGICWLVVADLLRRTEEHPLYRSDIAASSRAAWRWRLPQPNFRNHGVIAMSKRWRSTAQLNWWIIPLICGLNIAIQWRNTAIVIRAPFVGLPPFLIVAIFISVVGVNMTWFQQWKYRSLDLLRPVTRERFLTEVGTAIAIQTMQYWLLLGGIIVVTAVIFGTDFRTTAIILCLSLTTQVMIYGCSVWALRFRSAGLLVLIAVIACGAAAVLGFLMLKPSAMSLAMLAVGPCGMVLAGIGMTAVAYRQWLTTELD